jgi:hypothetical protein
VIRRLLLAAAVAGTAFATVAPAHALFCGGVDLTVHDVVRCVGDNTGHPCVPAVYPYFSRTCI